jgi:hypothetical protein
MSTSTSSRRRAAARERTGSADRPAAAIALWITLAVLAAVRALLSTPGSMAGWGYGLLRFAPSAIAWT